MNVAASRPPARLSEATADSTGASAAFVSALTTGMCAAVARPIAGPIPCELTGQTMIASTCWTTKFSICACCFARSKSPDVMISR
jgi:hypothetical protein